MGARHHRWAAVAAEDRMPLFLSPQRQFASARACLSGFAAKALAALAQSQGASRVAMSSPGVPLAARSSVGASALACDRCLRRCMQVQVVGLARAGARQHAMAGSAPAVAVPRIGASALAVQVVGRLAAALASTKGCCLTLRSWGLPPARHLAREALQVIIRLAGQAPSRRQPLSSNVRPHMLLVLPEGSFFDKNGSFPYRSAEVSEHLNLPDEPALHLAIAGLADHLICQAGVDPHDRANRVDALRCANYGVLMCLPLAVLERQYHAYLGLPSGNDASQAACESGSTNWLAAAVQRAQAEGIVVRVSVSPTPYGWRPAQPEDRRTGESAA